MNRIIPVFLAACLVLFCCGCSKQAAGGEGSTIPTQQEEDGPMIAAPQVDFMYTRVEQLAEESEMILLGQVTEAAAIDDSGSYYTVKVNETLRGKAQDVITLYGFSGLLEQGKEYALFLVTVDSVFYAKPLLVLTDTQSIIAVEEGERLSLPERFERECETVNQLRGVAKDTPGREAPQDTIPYELPYDRLVEASDVILMGKVTELTYVTAVGAGTATVAVTGVYKGAVEDASVTFRVPQGLAAGQAYLFFRSEGLTSIPTRGNSVFAADTQEAAELLALLGK